MIEHLERIEAIQKIKQIKRGTIVNAKKISRNCTREEYKPTYMYC